MTLDREGNIVLTYRPNNEEGHKRLIANARSSLHEAADAARCTGTSATRGCSRATCSSGSASRSPAWPTRTAPSASGTTRRPRRWTSNCRAHEVDNLYVVDGSFFPSSAAVNPALTIMANALRVGDHLKARLG